MSVEQKQHEALHVLAALNNAVSTSRMYPAISPKVVTAVERAYTVLQTFLDTYAEFSFGKGDNGPVLCGVEAAGEVQEEVEDTVVYRHLETLNLYFVALTAPANRKIFSDVLAVFTARKEKINREGGGRMFVDRLGLQSIFFETPSAKRETAAHPVKKAGEAVKHESLTELLGFLSGDNESEQARQDLLKLVNHPDLMAELIVMGIKENFRRLSQQLFSDKFVLSAAHLRFFQGLSTIIPPAMNKKTAERTVNLLFANNSEDLIDILVVQIYPEGFGQTFFEVLIARTEDETFARIVTHLREKSAQLKWQQKDHTSTATHIAHCLDKLLGSDKGKEFLAFEEKRGSTSGTAKDSADDAVHSGDSALLDQLESKLHDEDLLLALPSHIKALIDKGELETANTIVEKVSAEMLSGDDFSRRRLSQSLVLIGETLLATEQWRTLEKMTGALISWIRESDQGDYVYEKSVDLLQQIMNNAWQTGNETRGDQILQIFHKIRTGQLQKSSPVRALIGRIQDRAGNQQAFDTFLDRFLADKSDARYRDRLQMLGKPAVDFLLDHLTSEQESANWQGIIELLAEMGPSILPSVRERLSQHSPWYGKRNLIKLATEIAGSDDIGTFMPYLSHEDVRVQREAFICIYTISGDRRKQALLESLEQASEVMQGQIVKALQPFSDEETAATVAQLLRKQENYSDPLREPLTMEILRVLSRSGSVEAGTAIREFLDNQGTDANRQLTETVWQAARSALTQVEATLQTQAVRTADEVMSEVVDDRPQTPGLGAKKINLPTLEPASTTVKQVHDYPSLPGADAIMKLLKKSDTHRTKEAVLQTIEELVEKKQFNHADYYREWLMDIDPMALAEVVRAGEIIDEAKIKSVDTDHLQVWKKLCETLTDEEFATLYHAAEHQIYRINDVIVSQGEVRPGLFFINSGTVKLFFSEGGVEIPFKNAGSGTILGAETVFENTVWTLSLSSLSYVELMYMDADTLMRWRDDYPALETKLSDFCRKAASSENFFRQTRKDRRGARRYDISGRVTSSLVDELGEDNSLASKGDLLDVAVGGVALLLRIARKDIARSMLGKKIRVELSLENTLTKQIFLSGDIVAIRLRHVVENKYSVHVKFDERLSLDTLQSIVSANSEKDVRVF
jgi:CRP-like cAMP-binding protein